MVIFVNMILLHEVDHFFYPLNDDPMIVIEFVDFSTSSSSVFPSHDIYSLCHLPIGEISYYDLVSLIFDLSKDDHSYIPILKQFGDGSHMHVGVLVGLKLNDNLDHLKIIYLGDILTKSECTVAMSILIKCQKILTFSYKDMPGLDENIIMNNIITYPDTNPIKKKLHKFNINQSLLVKVEI